MGTKGLRSVGMCCSFSSHRLGMFLRKEPRFVTPTQTHHGSPPVCEQFGSENKHTPLSCSAQWDQTQLPGPEGGQAGGTERGGQQVEAVWGVSFDAEVASHRLLDWMMPDTSWLDCWLCWRMSKQVGRSRGNFLQPAQQVCAEGTYSHNAAPLCCQVKALHLRPLCRNHMLILRAL